MPELDNPFAALPEADNPFASLPDAKIDPTQLVPRYLPGIGPVSRAQPKQGFTKVNERVSSTRLTPEDLGMVPDTMVGPDAHGKYGLPTVPRPVTSDAGGLIGKLTIDPLAEAIRQRNLTVSSPLGPTGGLLPPSLAPSGDPKLDAYVERQFESQRGWGGMEAIPEPVKRWGTLVSLLVPGVNEVVGANMLAGLGVGLESDPMGTLKGLKDSVAFWEVNPAKDPNEFALRSFGALLALGGAGFGIGKFHEAKLVDGLMDRFEKYGLTRDGAAAAVENVRQSLRDERGGEPWVNRVWDSFKEQLTAKNLKFRTEARAKGLEEALGTLFEDRPALPISSIDPTASLKVEPMNLPETVRATEVAPKQVDAIAKEPWEMTRKEYAARRKEAKQAGKEWGEPITAHLAIVVNALREGKPVPPEVLADYPDVAADFESGYFKPKAEPLTGNGKDAVTAPEVEPVRPNADVLHHIQPDDPRVFDPFAEGYDPKLEEATYRANLGRAPERDADGFVTNADREALIDALHENYVKRDFGVDTTLADELLSYNRRTRLTKAQREVKRQQAVSLGGARPEGYYRIYRRNGKWFADARRPSRFVSLSSFDPWVATRLYEYALANANDDISYLSESKYAKWRSSGGHPRHHGAMRESEFIGRQFSGSVHDLDESGLSHIEIPNRIYQECLENARATMKAAAAQKSAAEQGYTVDELNAAIEYYSRHNPEDEGGWSNADQATDTGNGAQGERVVHIHDGTDPFAEPGPGAAEPRLNASIPNQGKAGTGPGPVESNATESPGQRQTATRLGDTFSDLLKDALDHRKDPTATEQGQQYMREAMARVFHSKVEATKALESIRGEFVKRGWDRSLDFVDRMERGLQQATQEDQHAAEAIRKVLDLWTDRLTQAGLLKSFVDDYFPHIWAKDAPGSVAAAFAGKRPLEGSKAFMKHRTIPTIKEGIDAGLSPLYENPIDMVIAKVGEMSRALHMHAMVERMKATGFAQYRDAFTPATELKADGLAKVEDPAFTAYGPKTVEVSEQYDAKATEALEAVMEALGIQHRRGGKVPKRGSLGVSDSANGNIWTREFTREDVLTHELGHSLDAKLGLGSWMAGKLGVAWTDESMALATHRYEGEVSDKFKEYTESPEERIANFVHAFVFAPKLAESIAPRSVQAFNEFIQAHPQLTPLRSIEPNLMATTRKVQVPVPGMRVMGHWVVPEELAASINRAVSPGLNQTIKRPAARLAWRAYTGINSAMNQINLSFSFFHGVNTSIHDVASELAIGIARGLRGDVAGLLKSTVRAPFAPALDWWQGGKIRQAYEKGSLDPNLTQYVEWALQGGMRPQASGFGPETAVGRWVDNWRQGKVLKGVFGTAGAALEAVMYPVLGSIVPRIKLAASMRLIEDRIAAYKGELSEARLNQIISEVSDIMDERFGQVVYDNLFMNRILRDAATHSARSFGWNLGTLKSGFKGATDSFTKATTSEPLPPRTAFLASSYLAWIAAGALVTYFLTGKAPKNLKDAAFPLTGRKNPDGTDERLKVPSYWNDWIAWAHDPVGTAQNKLAPGLGAIADLVRNKDYYGTEIVPDEATGLERILKSAEYFASKFTPFSMSGKKNAPDVGNLNYLGVQKAPGFMSTSRALDYAKEKQIENMKQGGRTSDETSNSQERAAIRQMAWNGEYDRAIQATVDLVRRTGKEIVGSKLKGEIDAIRSGATPLTFAARSLNLPELLHAYDLATPDEKRELLLAKTRDGRLIETKVGSWLKDHRSEPLKGIDIDETIGKHPELIEALKILVQLGAGKASKA